MLCTALAHAMHMPGKSQAYASQMPGTCLEYVWHVGQGGGADPKSMSAEVVFQIDGKTCLCLIDCL